MLNLYRALDTRIKYHFRTKSLDMLGTLVDYFGLILLNHEHQTKLVHVSNGNKESQRAINVWFDLDRILKYATAFKSRLKLELKILYLEKQ